VTAGVFHSVGSTEREDCRTHLLRRLTIILFFCCVACFFIRELSSLDVWFHIGAGRSILKQLAIPAHDIFSHTVTGRTWIDHAWFFQIIVSLLYRLCGANGLICFRMLVFLAAFAVLFRLGCQRIHVSLVIITLLPVLVLVHQRHFVRPEMVTLLFTALYIFFLRKHPSQHILYFLIPIQILWTNMHGYFFLGPVIVVTYSVAAMITAKKDDAKQLAQAAIVVLGVCIVNPYAYRIFLYPLRSLYEFFTHAPFLGSAIQELRAPLDPQLNNASAWWFRIVTVISAMLMLCTVRKHNPANFFLYTLFFIMAAVSFRHIALFGFVAAIVMFDAVNSISRQLRSTRIMQLVRTNQKIIENVSYAVCIIALFCTAQRLVFERYYVEGMRFKNVNFGISETQHSKGLIAFIKENDLHGNVFNDINIGAYLIGNAYPGFSQGL
jgi:hypothetical protein